MSIQDLVNSVDNLPPEFYQSFDEKDDDSPNNITLNDFLNAFAPIAQEEKQFNHNHHQSDKPSLLDGLNDILDDAFFEELIQLAKSNEK